MNNEICIKITPIRLVLAGCFAAVFGAAALHSSLPIRIAVTVFLVGCLCWNIYALYTLYHLRWDNIKM